MRSDSELQSARSKKARALERTTAAKLESDGYEILFPTAVCDRIAVKNGRVYFLEFKWPGQELRASQRKVQELMPESYLVFDYVVDEAL